MNRASIGTFGLIFSPISGPAIGETLDQALGTDRQVGRVRPEQLILKDPMIAGLMSAALPGLGQVYAGRRKRGLFFFIATAGALGVTAAFAEPAVLDLIDYDRVEYGGNGDGLMSVTELQNWDDGEFEDDAFKDLSTGRKVGAITSGAATLGLYIWNIIDARSSSRVHNREVVQRRIDLSTIIDQDTAGITLNLHF